MNTIDTINPIEIFGSWDKGYVLDRHTIRSIPIGEDEYGRMRFNTIRTQLGELVYQLKNNGKYENVYHIMIMIKPFLDKLKKIDTINAVIPAPPTQKRQIQPVFLISYEIAKYIRVKFLDDVFEKTSTMQAKNREEKTFDRGIIKKRKSGKLQSVLLFDDLYGTGATLNECAFLLKQDPLIKNVYALALTKTKG